MLKRLKLIIPITLPVFIAYLFLGMGYGVLMNKAGFSWLIMQASSLFVYAGALQFASIALLLAPFNPIATAFMALMINLRHLFYGMSLLKDYKHLGIKKGFMIFALTDETFSINAAASIPEGIPHSSFYFTVSILNYIYWNVSGSIGYLLANWVPNHIRGIEFILIALFYALFLGQWDKREARLSLSIGLIASVLGLIIMGSQNFLLFSMILIIAALALTYRNEVKRES